ncbi:MAG: restriction endonuclease subunit S [Lachnospiraceae bacterium]|nr:restriction endonuclease subunit S [Lachnospiraceae bacterium]
MLGKINASLNAKLDNIEWGEYRLGDLFEIKSTSSFNADNLVYGNEYDYVTRTSTNQGVMCGTGFINEENINEAGTWSLGLLQMDFFYRNREWYAGQFVRKIVPKINIPNQAIPFFTTVLNQQKPLLLSVLVRNVDDTFENIKVKLPTKDGEIDFDSMQELMSELKKYHIANVEDHLRENKLYDYKFSDNEREFIAGMDITASLSDKLNQIQWKEYRIGELFVKIKTNKLPYKAKDLPNSPTGNNVLPCLTSSFRNQGLNYFVTKEGATILKNVISIPSNSDVYRAYYQPKEFTVLSDAYAVCWKDNKQIITENQYLFMVTCINKVTDLPIYSYKNKLGGWNVVKNKKMLLPSKNGQIDYQFMDMFICMMKKS